MMANNQGFWESNTGKFVGNIVEEIRSKFSNLLICTASYLSQVTVYSTYTILHLSENRALNVSQKRLAVRIFYCFTADWRISAKQAFCARD